MPASIGKSEGSNESVHRCSRIRMTAFILIKSIELLCKNSNDERTSMYRYIVVVPILTEAKVATVGEFGT